MWGVQRCGTCKTTWLESTGECKCILAGSSRQSPEHIDTQQQLHAPTPDPATHPKDPPDNSDPSTASAQQPTGSPQPPGADPALASPQEAAQSSGDDSSVAPHVPPELRALTAWLRGNERLKTAGLFVNSADAAMLCGMHQPARQATAETSREPNGGCALGVKQVREALDRGQEVHPPPQPNTVSGHNESRNNACRLLLNSSPL